MALRFRALFADRSSFSFPCDATGHVDMDSLSERTLNNYLYARAVMGFEVFMAGSASERSALNRLLDHFGVLDADYLRARTEGSSMWVLPAKQTPVDNGGRYLVIVDTERTERPARAPAPGDSDRRNSVPPAP